MGHKLKRGTVYLAINQVNFARYVGQTWHDLKYRKQFQGFIVSISKNSKNKFLASLRRYGYRAFRYIALAYADNQEQLDILEAHFIKKFNTHEDGLNGTSSGKSR